MFNLFYTDDLGKVCSLNFDNYTHIETTLGKQSTHVNFLIDNRKVLTIDTQDILERWDLAFNDDNRLLEIYTYLIERSIKTTSDRYKMIGLIKIKEIIASLDCGSNPTVLIESIYKKGTAHIVNLIQKRKSLGKNDVMVYHELFIDDIIRIFMINYAVNYIENEVNKVE